MYCGFQTFTKLDENYIQRKHRKRILYRTPGNWETFIDSSSRNGAVTTILGVCEIEIEIERERVMWLHASNKVIESRKYSFTLFRNLLIYKRGSMHGGRSTTMYRFGYALGRRFNYDTTRMRIRLLFHYTPPSLKFVLFAAFMPRHREITNHHIRLLTRHRVTRKL